MYRLVLAGLCALLITSGVSRPTMAASVHTVFLPLTIGGGTAAPIASDSLDGDHAAVVQLTNEYRVSQGCAPLNVVPELMRSAQLHSEDMATNQYFSHTGLNGSTPGSRMRAQGYIFRLAGENIAVGYESPQKVVQAWIDSPSHRENMVNCSFMDIGVGVAFAKDGSPYWTQTFGTR